MTNDTQWTAPNFELVLPDRATWPFTRRDQDAAYQPPNGWWIMYVLDTATGRLTAVPNHFSNPRGPQLNNGGGGYDSTRDLWVKDYHWDYAPRLIGFPWAFHYPLPVDRVYHDLDLIAPRAERLLTHLQPVPGTTGWDWTPEAAMAHGRICSITHWGFTDMDVPGLDADTDPDLYVMTLDRVMHLYPELERGWAPLAVMSDAQLDELAARLSDRSIPPPPPKGLIADTDNAGWSEWRGRAEKRAPGDYMCVRYVVGARASLYRLRAERAEALTGYPAVPASPFLAEHPAVLADRVSPDLSAADVDQLAGQVAAEVGRDHHLTLTGVIDHVLTERARLRELVRRELDRVGAQAANAAQVARQLGSRRTHLVAQIVAWEDAADQRDGSLNQAALAERAHMSRQGLGQLLARLEPAADD